MKTDSVRSYLLASLCLGAISAFGSENLFWSAPTDGLRLLEVALMVLLYGLCSAAVLTCVLRTGLGGWRALFLGGALLGWFVEGVAVATTYDAFPAQLVWTPLAWHALITGLCLGGLCRQGVRWPVWQQLAGLIALGLFAGSFALYWPLERGQMPGFGPTFAYLVGLGVIVPLANLGLDRIGHLRLPAGWVPWVAPGLLALYWAIMTVVTLNPVRLSLPVLLVLTLWAMWRLAGPQAGAARLDLGGQVPVWRHALFLVTPLVVTALAVPGWQMTGGVATNVILALTTGGLGLCLLLWLLARAALTPRAN